MSEEQIEHEIAKLMSDARRAHDARVLDGIARRLEKLGAWPQAREVERMADTIREREAEQRLRLAR